MHITHLPIAQDIEALKVAQISLEEHSQVKQAWTLCPLTTELAMKKVEDSNMCSFVDVKANKHNIKQAGKKCYENGIAKVKIWSGLMEKRRHIFNWLF